jgi:hypothetical protein
MQPYRLALLRKEFPFLAKMSGALKDYDYPFAEHFLDCVTDIKVMKGDIALLNKKGNEDSYSKIGGGHHNYRSYVAVWNDGKTFRLRVLKNVGIKSTETGDRAEYTADTVGEQLFAQKIVPDYIIEAVKNDHDDKGNGIVTRFWTIYKMRHFDLSKHHQEQIDIAAVALKAEIAVACA